MTKLTRKSAKLVSQSVGAEIKRIRKKAQLTQTECAHHCGLEQSAWCRIEQGKQQPTLVQFIAFCAFIGEPVSCFFAVWRAAIKQR